MADFLQTYLSGLSNAPLFGANVAMAGQAAQERQAQAEQAMRQYQIDVAARTAREALEQQGRQFGEELGFKKEAHAETIRQFGETLGFEKERFLKTALLEQEKMQQAEKEFLTKFNLDSAKYNLDVTKWTWERDVLGPLTAEELRTKIAKADSEEELNRIIKEGYIELQKSNKAAFNKALFGVTSDAEQSIKTLLAREKEYLGALEKTRDPVIKEQIQKTLQMIQTLLVGGVEKVSTNAGFSPDPISVFQGYLQLRGNRSLSPEELKVQIDYAKRNAADPKYVENEMRRINAALSPQPDITRTREQIREELLKEKRSDSFLPTDTLPSRYMR